MKIRINVLFRSLAVTLLGVNLILVAGQAAAVDSDLAATISQLERAAASHPENTSLHYYLGNLYLRAGDQNGAIRQWDAFVKNARADSRLVAVREQLTVLRMNQAREEAKRALAEGDAGAKPAANTIAVLEFKNNGPRSFDPFVKGMTAMIITDLAKVPQLQVVERARMEALVSEMKLGQMGVVNPNTSARVGRLLQAQTINWGELSAPGASNVKIRAEVSDTYSQSKVGEAVAEGPAELFFEMEKKLVFDILASIGINKEDLPESVVKAIEAVETRNYNAFILFGTGLMYLDNRNYAEAKQAFAEAADVDPDFDLADTAEKTTPVVDTVAVGYTAEAEQQETQTAATEPAPADTSSSSSASSTSSRSDTTSTTTSEPAPADTTSTDTAFAAAEPQDTSQQSVDATQAAIDAATDVRQDEVVIATVSGPVNIDGYFTNMLRNAAGDYHGTYYTSWLQDLTSWEAFSTWPNGSATGAESVIESLIVVDNTDPVTTGLPNEFTLTELGVNEYLAWGTWSDGDEMVRASNPKSPNGHYVFDATGYYIYGDETTVDQMTEVTANEISALYTGDAWGTHIAAPNVVMAGTFEAVVGFFMGQVDISGVNMSISGGSHSASVADATGYAFDGGAFEIFGGTVMVDGNPIQTMDEAGGTGSFYGPGAEYMGGIFWIEADGGVNAVNGMFLGQFDSTIQ